MPPADLRHLTHLQGTGVLVGATVSQVHFSEDYEPENWPSRYDLTLPGHIINLGTLDTWIFVTTDVGAFVIDGRLRDLDQERPVMRAGGPPDIGCGWHRQAAATPFGLVYSSAEGLTLVKPDGGTEILTVGWYSPEQWRKLRPETCRLVYWRGFLVAVTEAVTFMLGLEGKKFGDYELGALTTLTIKPTDFCVTENGELIYLDENTRTLYQWDAGESRLPYAWESKDLELGSTSSPSSAKVKTDGTNFALIAGELRFDRFVADETPFRLGRLGRHRYYRVGFYGTGVVDLAELGYTISTLPQGA
jgi:hypothetical protein